MNIKENFSETSFKILTIWLPEHASNWIYVYKFLAYRKEVFIGRMGWPLIHAEGSEYEQYDTIDTVYIVALDGDEVVGGARLRRTDMKNGHGVHTYSYMIRDAWLGALPGLPQEMCSSEPPVDPKIWELTRFAAENYKGLAEAILRASNKFLYDRGATHCLFLGPPAFLRVSKRLGWTPQPLGPVTGNEDGRFLAFQCNVTPPLGG